MWTRRRWLASACAHITFALASEGPCANRYIRRLVIYRMRQARRPRCESLQHSLLSFPMTDHIAMQGRTSCALAPTWLGAARPMPPDAGLRLDLGRGWPALGRASWPCAGAARGSWWVWWVREMGRRWRRDGSVASSFVCKRGSCILGMGWMGVLGERRVGCGRAWMVRHESG